MALRSYPSVHAWIQPAGSLDAVQAVAEPKRSGTNMSTLGSLTLCRSLLEAGLVDPFRVGVFPGTAPAK